MSSNENSKCIFTKETDCCHAKVTARWKTIALFIALQMTLWWKNNVSNIINILYSLDTVESTDTRQNLWFNQFRCKMTINLDCLLCIFVDCYSLFVFEEFHKKGKFETKFGSIVNYNIITQTTIAIVVHFYHVHLTRFI